MSQNQNQYPPVLTASTGAPAQHYAPQQYDGRYQQHTMYATPPPGYPQGPGPSNVAHGHPVQQGQPYGAPPPYVPPQHHPQHGTQHPHAQGGPPVGRPVQGGSPTGRPPPPMMNFRIEGIQQRAQYNSEWQTTVLKAPCANPLWCLFSAFCAPCSSFIIRKQILRGDMSRYLCCGGMMPCSGRCGEQRCPSLCLCAETFCCFANSVMSSRFMIQDELKVMNTKTDNCIIGTMIFLQQLACICQCAAMLTDNEAIDRAADIISCLADVSYCSVCACIQAQHRLELNVRDGVTPPKNPNGTAAALHEAPGQQYMQK